MNAYGWGLFPRMHAEINYPLTRTDCFNLLTKTPSLIPRGLGRSYGDSSLASVMLDTHYLNHFINFDHKTGLLTCLAGVSLDDILQHVLPQGWFLPVTPGTRFVSIGGAIACDVHGKNHHLDGAFSDHITEIELLLGNGDVVLISKTQKSELFHATCGGMGLTGIILKAIIQLKPISSNRIIQTTIKAPDIDALLEHFTEYENVPYSVAWIDCMAKRRQLGRGIITLGAHAEQNNITIKNKKKWSIPFEAPSCLLNSMSIKTFNYLCYAKQLQKKQTTSVHMDSFFYPLDRVANWNRLYGKAGFLQYQFVLPLSTGVDSLKTMLTQITSSGLGSCLAVLKRLGRANKNMLSFPLEGYTLALDFKNKSPVFPLLEQLDRIVLNHGGRLYLAKDARMSEQTFKASYPSWEKFENVREHYHAIGKFSSKQSKRLGLK